MGDTEMWTRHLPLAWQAAAADAPDAPVPSAPDLDDLDGKAAYWTAPLHLLVFGLGWSRVDLGLEAWRDRDFPLDDPILRVIHRWWGARGTLDFLGWASGSAGAVAGIGSGVVAATSRTTNGNPIDDRPEYRQVRSSTAWQRMWGDGSDPFHLQVHVLTPAETATGPYRLVRSPDEGTNEPPRAHLFTDSYAGWYRLLTQLDLKRERGRSIRTDVVVKPVGWLGEFRWHTETGRWFRGRAATHLWGQ